MNRPKPIKPFKTLDEEAKFWDTHDTSPLFGNSNFPLEKLPLIEPEKEEVLSVRVQRSVKDRLTWLARARGIGPTTLARMWILERLGIGVKPLT
ncbi:hypothetical protein HY087_01925 [Candidatus Gottesmanbacteria bacterium]|nr:hypothetical protein [Candidatus Gottesmanbacteria bacterium]